MKNFNTKKELIKTIHLLANGKISINDFITTYTYSIEEALEIAKKNPEFTQSEIYFLTRAHRHSLFYQTPFDRDQYKECCAIIVDGKRVKPTDKQIDACIDYIREHDFYECDFTIRTLVALYLTKKIDMKSENSSHEFQEKLELLEKKKLLAIQRPTR